MSLINPTKPPQRGEIVYMDALPATPEFDIGEGQIRNKAGSYLDYKTDR